MRLRIWRVAVSFTDEDEEAMLAKGYQWEQSELGKVYYPSQGVVIRIRSASITWNTPGSPALRWKE